MLIKNGEIIKAETNPEYQQFIKHELKQLPNPVVFRYPRPVVINPTGLKEEPPVFNILMTAKVESADGLDVWAYSEGMKRESATGHYVPDKKSIIARQGEISVPHTKPDFIFFLYKKSRQLGSTFLLEDKNAQARERAVKKAATADFNAILWGRTSPLNDEVLLRDIASAFGVARVADKVPDIIKEELEVIVLRNEEDKKTDPSAWGITEFLEKAQGQQDIKRLAIAQKALDDGIVEYDTLSFYYRMKESGDKLLLVTNDKFDNKEKFFVNEIVRHTDLWNIIKHSVITPEMIDTFKTAKEYGWLADEEGLPPTMKKDEKIAKLKEIYS